MKKYQSKSYLVQKYIKEGLSMTIIARVLDVNSGTIFYWLKKHGLEMRGRVEAGFAARGKSYNLALKTILNKKWLYKKYITEFLSEPKIAKLSGVSGRTVSEWLKRFKIPRRASGDYKGEKSHRYGTHHSPERIKQISAFMVKWHKNHASPMKGRLREKSSNWKGGQCLKDGKRVLLYQPNNPQADCRGYVRRSRMIAEKALGRPLKRNEDVHHINGNPADDRNRNLLICGHSYHAFLEARIKELNWKPSEVWP